MRINTFLLKWVAASLLFVPALSAQEAVTALYLYKTKEDFFNKDKDLSYRGSVNYWNNNFGWTITYKTPDSKKHKLNLDDSASLYFAYEYATRDGIVKKVRDHPEKGDYSVFVGGTAKTYATCNCLNAAYNSDGSFAEGLRYEGRLSFSFYYQEDNADQKGDIEAVLRSKPALLDRYQNEKWATDAKVWRRNQGDIELKYFKLFLGQN
jgi:hypothetical protein